MSQIRSDIFYHHQKKRAKELDTKIQRLHIAAPIVEDDSLNNPEFDNLCDDDLQVSDDTIAENENQSVRSNNIILNEPAEPHTEEQEQEWSTFVSEWINAIEHENMFDHPDDEVLLTNEMNNDFNFGGRVIHLADNLIAKWPLVSLFVSSLELPTYLEIYSALK